jgi:tetratricopeptide (TPR) repeat protein
MKAHNTRGIVYYVCEEYQKALSDFEKLISLYPQEAVAYRGRAAVYMELGEDQKAVSDFTQAINLDPLSEENYRDRGELYQSLAEHAKSETLRRDYQQKAQADFETAEKNKQRE